MKSPREPRDETGAGDRASASEPEDEDFARAMADVVRLPPDPRERVRPIPFVGTPAPSTPSLPPSPGLDSDESPDAGFVAPGIDRRELRRLKHGEYRPDSRLDVHGMTAAEAVAAVTRLLDNGRHARQRTVAIVHGRGLHSEGNVAVLKTRVREYLRQHQAVLAYADAPRDDGGPGAVYVLLRR